MPDDKKIKLYKNPERGIKEKITPYVPQYKIEGITPEMKNFSSLGQAVPPPNPRLRQPMQPYVATSSPIRGVSNVMPNVGNNIEQTWSTVDSDVVDSSGELIVDDTNMFIDNNEFVTNKALGLPSSGNPSSDAPESGELYPALVDLKEGDLILLISGTPICSGSLDDIKDQTKDLVFGDHKLCNGEPVPLEDIVILKKVSIKVGLFLE